MEKDLMDSVDDRPSGYECYEEEKYHDTMTDAQKTPVAGYWLIDTGKSSTSLVLMMYRKPRWLTRMMMKWFFEVEWRSV